MKTTLLPPGSWKVVRGFDRDTFSHSSFSVILLLLSSYLLIPLLSGSVCILPN